MLTINNIGIVLLYRFRQCLVPCLAIIVQVDYLQRPGQYLCAGIA